MAVFNDDNTYNGACTFAGTMTANGQLTTAGAVDMSGSTVTFAAGGIAANAMSGGVRTNAAGAALAIGATDRCILFSSNAGGAVAMSSTGAFAGQRVVLVMTAFDTDAYTLAVDGGALTFNAAGETAEIVYDGTAWRDISLNGATVV